MCLVRESPQAGDVTEEEARTAVSPSHVTTRTYDNPLGRASLQRPTPFQLERASVVRLPALHMLTPMGQIWRCRRLAVLYLLIKLSHLQGGTCDSASCAVTSFA